LEPHKLQQVNTALANLLHWVRNLISYHVLVHPYRIRNTQTIQLNSEVHQFASTVDSFMDQFYQLKAFLVKQKQISADTNFAFNLSHVKFNKKDKRAWGKELSQALLGTIACFLNEKGAFLLGSASQDFRLAVASHWDCRLSDQILKIEVMKSEFYQSLSKKIPLLYEGGFFSPYLKMLDRILIQEKQFISRYHLEEIKAIVKPSKLIKLIIQAFCMLVGVKPVRRGLPNGVLEIDYFQPFQQLSKANKLHSLINDTNKVIIKGEILQNVNLYINSLLR